MVTQDLVRRRLIQRQRSNQREWAFFAIEEPEGRLPELHTPREPSATGTETLGSAIFESLARRILSDFYGVPLSSGSLNGVRKRFDLVSADGRIAGDAKYFTRVRGVGLPPAKFSIIAEHMWLLEKCRASERFLVFGNDRNVPILWLDRYGNLNESVAFYFLTDDGQLEKLASPATHRRG